MSVVAMKLRNGSRAKGTQEGRDVVQDIRQATLFPLSKRTNTSRDAYAPPWEWVEACVWTPRMLAALESNGVRDGKWHSLIDKVYALPTLSAAWAEVRANKGAAGVDHHYQRWPNAYFEAQGLYSFVTAAASKGQSLRR